MLRFCAAALSLTLLSCASTQEASQKKVKVQGVKKQTSTRFPTADALKDIKASEGEVLQKVHEPERFKLIGDLPDDIGQTPVEVKSALGRLFKANAPDAKRSLQMDCVARQVAHFLLEFDSKIPASSVKLFIQSRCGADIVDYAFSSQGGVVNEYNDDLLISQQSASLEEGIKTFAASFKEDVGIALVRKNNRVMIVFAAGQRALRLEKSMTQVDAVPEFKGALQNNVEEIFALASKGKYETIRCTTFFDSGRFQFSCPLDKNDDAVSIDIGVRTQGNVLGRRVASLMFRPSGAEVREFVQSRYSKKIEVSSESELSVALLTALNDVRKDAGLQSVRKAPQQSEVVGTLVRPFFAAQFGNNSKVLDQISLGVMAGWNVEGNVQNGGIGFGHIAPSNDVSRLLAQVLDRPNGRSILLDPDVDQIAIGALVENKAMAFIVGVYDTVDSTAFEKESEQLFAQLEKAFAEKEIGAPLRFSKADPALFELVRAVEEGVISFDDAVQTLTDNTVKQSTKGVRTMVFGVPDKNKVEFPPELLVPGIELTLALCHVPPVEGEPWRQYAVFVVIHAGQEQSAMLR